MALADESKNEEPQSEYGDMMDDAQELVSASEERDKTTGENGAEKTEGAGNTVENGAKKAAGDNDGEKIEKENEPTEVPGESEVDFKNQPMFVCCCGASFQFLGQITSHKKKACQWIYVCPHCDRVYKDFDKMELHKKTHNTTIKAEIRAQAIVTEPLKKDVAPPVDAKTTDSAAVDSTNAVAEKKTAALANQEPKSIPKVVERNLPKKTLIIRPPPIIRPKGPNFPQGNNILGNRPNFVPNQGMMNPGFQGGFNQGMGMMNPQMGMMNTQMGMGNCGPMNMGMGNFGPNMCGPNMMSGMNVGMNNMNMGMGMNMGNFNPNMGGQNMMGGMNMGMNMGNYGPNMSGNYGPMGCQMGMNQGSNMGGGPNMPHPNMGGGHNIAGPNVGGPIRPPGSKMLSDKKSFGSEAQNIVNRGRALTPPGRRSLTPPRRRESRSPLRRESPRRELHSQDEYARWRDSSRDRSRDRDLDIDLFRRDDDRPDRPDRPSPWAQRSMTREEFLSMSAAFNKERDNQFPKSDVRDDLYSKDRRDVPYLKDRRDDLLPRHREYSPRDDGPPGLGKYGVSGGSYKRENSDPLSKHPAKMLRPF